MNFKQITHAIWEDERVIEQGIRKTDVKVVLEVFFDIVKELLVTKQRVRIKGLFTMESRLAKGRPMRLFDGTPTNSRDYYKIVVKPSKELKQHLVEVAEEETKQKI